MYWLLFTCLLFVTANNDNQSSYVEYNSTEHTYQLMYRAKIWTAALDMCARNGGKLAVPKTETEFLFLQKIVRGMHYPSIIGADFRLMVWLGISNLHSGNVWRNVDGENIENTNFHVWAGQYNGLATSSDPREPHCAGMDAANYGLRDYWCHRRLAYICKIKRK